MECVTSVITTNPQIGIIFTPLQTQKLLFRSRVASSTMDCCMQPAKTSIRRCFSLSTSFIVSGIHATAYSTPNALVALFGVYDSSFWLQIRSLTLQIFAAVRAVLGVPLYRSRLDPLDFSLIPLKIIQNCFYIFSVGN